MFNFLSFKSTIPHNLRYAFIFFVILFSFQVLAEDLTTIYNLAVNNDPQYTAAISEYNAIQESKVQSYSVFLPQINMLGYVSDVEQDIKGGILPGNKKFNNVGYSVIPPFITEVKSRG